MTSSCVCPVCKRSDDIRKVSTIAGQSTYRSQYDISSLLDRHLKPPMPPRLKHTLVPWSFTLVILLLVAAWCTIAVLLLIFFISWNDGAQTIPLLAISALDTLPILLIMRILFGLEFLALLVFLLHLFRNKALKTKEERIQRQNQEKQGRWQLAMQRWNALYYCYRDDLVFSPDHPQRWVQPAFMYRLL